QRLSKFIWRHRSVVTALMLGLAVAVLVLLVFLALLLFQTQKTEDALLRARESEKEARGNLRASEERLEDVWRAVNDTYLALARDWVANQPHLEPEQRRYLQKAAALFEKYARTQSDNPRFHLERARAYRRVGEIRDKLGQHQQFQAAYDSAIRFVGKLL